MARTLTFAEEAVADEPVIHKLNTEAFGQPDEAQLVRSLRENGGLVFSAVAKLREEVVAHLAYSPIMIGGLASEPPSLALAPVAVAPPHQRQGYGSALIRWSLDELRNRRCPAVIVLGEPAFYSRCGFQPAAHWNIFCPFDVPAEYFMALDLRDGALEGGVVVYRPEFAALS